MDRASRSPKMMMMRRKRKGKGGDVGGDLMSWAVGGVSGGGVALDHKEVVVLDGKRKGRGWVSLGNQKGLEGV
ncbi:hypothetical protein L6452_34803 [Arctium lappa]|uniref:Uncharacterized protein n=1 Tax=Arctium lappa TaxID=4217 RepID=A0ACB8YNF7_ARCLA|nr:hypothetical protein L6452_34803 [Arctium lappa]